MITAGICDQQNGELEVGLHSSNPDPVTSALGQKRTSHQVRFMSAVPPEADVAEIEEPSLRHALVMSNRVRFTPQRGPLPKMFRIVSHIEGLHRRRDGPQVGSDCRIFAGKHTDISDFNIGRYDAWPFGTGAETIGHV
jgi:hypothetical protein